MRKFALSALLAGCLLTGPAAAEKPPELVAAPEAGKLVGASSVRVLFWRLFDAELFSPSGQFDWDAPFALALTYARPFTAKDLAEKTVEEMARISGSPEVGFAGFGETFETCVSDVAEGDRITAVSAGPDTARLYLNGAERCTLERPGLRRDFFGIWLGADTQFPEASARLVGKSP